MLLKRAKIKTKKDINMTNINRSTPVFLAQIQAKPTLPCVQLERFQDPILINVDAAVEAVYNSKNKRQEAQNRAAALLKLENKSYIKQYIMLLIKNASYENDVTKNGKPSECKNDDAEHSNESLSSQKLIETNTNYIQSLNAILNALDTSIIKQRVMPNKQPNRKAVLLSAPMSDKVWREFSKP
jgi:hypothetical protein